MNHIAKEDWGFEDIQDVDPVRATRLEGAGSSDELEAELEESLRRSIAAEQVRIAVDSKGNRFDECRCIIQFPVPPDTYDWFFNARTMARVLAADLPENVTARRIDVGCEGQSREETDAGPIKLRRDNLVDSLDPGASKIWIGERLYSRTSGRIKQIGVAELLAAERTSAKLRVPRWAEAVNPSTGVRGEGLRAPIPIEENSWLDLKGGFVGRDGMPEQIKPQYGRAVRIYTTGWT
jgi:hypothetical protein